LRKEQETLAGNFSCDWQLGKSMVDQLWPFEERGCSDLLFHFAETELATISRKPDHQLS